MQPMDKMPEQSWIAVTETAEPAEVEGYLIDEIFKALGLRADSRWRSWFGPVFKPLISSFARKAVAFDQSVAENGFQYSAQELLSGAIPGLRIHGAEQLPLDGPLLIAANHPGTFDSLAVSSAVPRQDLKIVAAANPFFRALPNTRQYLIYSTLDTHVRMTTIRNAIRHLSNGGVLLIFPSGKLDPDPQYFRQAARQSLAKWSPSLAAILRKVPQARMVVAINSGFVAPQFMQNPIVRLRSSDEGRQRLAEFIQVIQQVVSNQKITSQPRVMISRLLSFSPHCLDEADMMGQIVATAAQLLEDNPLSDFRQIPERTT